MDYKFDPKEISSLIDGANNCLDRDKYERAKTEALIAIAETLFNIWLYQYPIDIVAHQIVKEDSNE